MQVFLAMPADCPVEPSGAKRNTPASATGRNSVSMYISDDEALTFNQVSRMPLGTTSLAGHALLDCLENGCLMWLKTLDYFGLHKVALDKSCCRLYDMIPYSPPIKYWPK